MSTWSGGMDSVPWNGRRGRCYGNNPVRACVIPFSSIGAVIVVCLRARWPAVAGMNRREPRVVNVGRTAVREMASSRSCSIERSVLDYVFGRSTGLRWRKAVAGIHRPALHGKRLLLRYDGMSSGAFWRTGRPRRLRPAGGAGGYPVCPGLFVWQCLPDHSFAQAARLPQSGHRWVENDLIGRYRCARGGHPVRATAFFYLVV